MTKGGYRAGAGRPPGRGRKASGAASVPYPRTGPDLTGIEYLQALVNDESAEPIRRDRAAGLLASIEFRSGQVPTGKRARAQQDAAKAGWLTEWYGLLHDVDAPDFDPNGLPEAERAAWYNRRQEKPTPSPKPADAAKAEPKADEDDKWRRYLGDDELDFGPMRLPGERPDARLPPDDE